MTCQLCREDRAYKICIVKQAAPRIPQHGSKSYGVLVGQARAAQVGAPLTMVPDLAAYEGGAGARLGLAGAHQRVNAALAVALAGAWEARYAAEHKVW